MVFIKIMEISNGFCKNKKNNNFFYVNKMVRLLSPTSLSRAKRTSPVRKAGGRLKKGTAKAKRVMAAVRSAKKNKSPTAVASPTALSRRRRKARSPTAVASPTTLSRRRRKARSPTAVASPTTLSRRRRK